MMFEASGDKAFSLRNQGPSIGGFERSCYDAILKPVELYNTEIGTANEAPELNLLPTPAWNPYANSYSQYFSYTGALPLDQTYILKCRSLSGSNLEFSFSVSASCSNP